MPQWIDACSIDDKDAEDVIRFDHGDSTYIIVRDDKDNYYCTGGMCTHEAVHLSDGLVVEATIECPKHSSVFDCATGEVETPPACANLCTYPTKIVGDRVLVEV